MNLGLIGTKIMGASTAAKTAMVATAVVIVEVGAITAMKIINEAPEAALGSKVEAPLDLAPSGTTADGATSETAQAFPVGGEEVTSNEESVRGSAEIEVVKAGESIDQEADDDVSSEKLDGDKQTDTASSTKKLADVAVRSTPRSPYRPPE